MKGGNDMAYEKRTWVSGVTKCSAENFNHMEDGIETAQKGVDELNTNSIGYNQMAYVTFASYGDKWWISSPVPCHMADKFNIRLSDNIKNSTSNNKSELSQTLFEIRKYKNYFYILTNDTSVAGYTFGTVHPGIVWEVYFSVIKS